MYLIITLTFLLPSYLSPIFIIIVGYYLTSDFIKSRKRKRKVDNMELKFFGEIDIKNKQDFEISTKINENKVKIELSFENNKIPKIKALIINEFLDYLSELDTKALNEIKIEYYNENVLIEYIEHHFEELNKVELEKIGIDFSKSIDEQKIAMLNKIYLKKIIIYPEDNNHFAVFDYTINEKLTQYIIAITYDIEENICGIEMES